MTPQSFKRRAISVGYSISESYLKVLFSDLWTITTRDNMSHSLSNLTDLSLENQTLEKMQVVLTFSNPTMETIDQLSSLTYKKLRSTNPTSSRSFS